MRTRQSKVHILGKFCLPHSKVRTDYQSSLFTETVEKRDGVHIRLDQIRLHNVLVPMQCSGNSGCFPPAGKASGHSAALPSSFSSYVQCFHVSIPPAARTILLRQMDMGSLTCAHIWVRAVHTKGGQEQAGLHKS